MADGHRLPPVGAPLPPEVVAQVECRKAEAARRRERTARYITPKTVGTLFLFLMCCLAAAFVYANME